MEDAPGGCVGRVRFGGPYALTPSERPEIYQKYYRLFRSGHGITVSLPKLDEGARNNRSARNRALMTDLRMLSWREGRGPGEPVNDVSVSKAQEEQPPYTISCAVTYC